MAEDEAILMRCVAQADRQAFTALATHHLPLIERFALRSLGDASRAQDVAQEVMLRMWQRAEQYDPAQAKLTTWLHQMAHNLCIDQHRLRARFTPLDEHSSAEGEVEAPAPDDPQSVDLALRSLPVRQRTALVLTYYQSLPNQDVAQIMGLTVRALESLLVRARKALRQSLERSL